MGTFRIQDRQFEAPIDPREGGAFVVKSVPRPYRVEFPAAGSPGDNVAALAAEARHPLLLVDRRVASLHLDGVQALRRIPRLDLDAREENKNLPSVLKVIEFLNANRATKGSMIFVVGGGIIQDIAAFAVAMYKRGLPWTLIPSTLLAQGDSGIGSKAALNHAGAKNQLGLFSAPRRVVIDTGFHRTLSESDRLSGLGEVFRLHITGGPTFVEAYEKTLAEYLAGSEKALRRLLVGALSVKRAVIEVDEFEVDLRRALNYGHSFGHALEALSEYRIPHGVAVTVGMLVENEIALNRRILGQEDRARVIRLGARLVSPRTHDELRRLQLRGVLDLLRSDKKTEGKTLKLVVPERIGSIRFIDFELDRSAETLISDCLSSVVNAL